MATMNINIKPAILSAETNIFSTTDLVNPQNIIVLNNDSLGVTPTIVSTIDNTAFSLGAVTINIDNQRLVFTPNGNIGTSSIKYTIQDNIGRTSIATVIITTQ